MSTDPLTSGLIAMLFVAVICLATDPPSWGQVCAWCHYLLNVESKGPKSQR